MVSAGNSEAASAAQSRKQRRRLRLQRRRRRQQQKTTRRRARAAQKHVDALLDRLRVSVSVCVCVYTGYAYLLCVSLWDVRARLPSALRPRQPTLIAFYCERVSAVSPCRFWLCTLPRCLLGHVARRAAAAGSTSSWQQ